MKLPSLLLLIPELKVGGTETQVIELASGLRKKGWNVNILCLFREGVLAEFAAGKNVPVSCLRLPYGWNLKTLMSVFQWLQLERPDILHSFLSGFDFFAAFPAKLARIPVVLSARRGRALTHWKKLSHRWIENVGNRFVDKIVCNSEEGRDWAIQNEKVDPAKIVSIPNGVEWERFTDFSSSPELKVRLGIPEKALVVGTIANFSPEKGYDFLLQAAAILLKKRPDTWFLWVGSGPLWESLKSKARSLERGNQIVFAGSRRDTADLLALMDIFVLPSLLEACPNALLEAMAAARPIVACSTGGIPELVKNGQEGILVSAGDSKALAEAIFKLLENPVKGEEYGRAAQARVRQQFSQEIMIHQYEKLYYSLMSQGGNSNLSLCEVSR